MTTSERVTIPEAGYATPAPPDDKSEHQLRVERMMRGYGQKVRDRPELPSKDERRLRARLILEECLETVQALGFLVLTKNSQDVLYQESGVADSWELQERKCGPNLIEIADGCADISVVTIGTLSACGIRDQELLEEVDHNNLTKVERGSNDEHGKFTKPEGHVPPDIAGVLARQKNIGKVTGYIDGGEHVGEVDLSS